MGFSILKEGPNGFLAKRDETGKLIAILYPEFKGDPTGVWLKHQVHPFIVHGEKDLFFCDLLSMEDLKAI